MTGLYRLLKHQIVSNIKIHTAKANVTAGGRVQSAALDVCQICMDAERLDGLAAVSGPSRTSLWSAHGLDRVFQPLHVTDSPLHACR